MEDLKELVEQLKAENKQLIERSGNEIAYLKSVCLIELKEVVKALNESV